MDDSEAQERISALFGLIKGINPHDKKLTNQEKLDLIFGERDEKLEAIKKVFGELEMDFDAIHDHEDMDHTQVAYDIKEIKEILEK